MIKHLIAGVSLLLLAGVSFAQSTSSITASNKHLTHSVSVNALQTAADTVGISDVFDRCMDRIVSIRYDVTAGKVIVTSEPSLNTKDLMEMLLASGYTSYYINSEGKKIVMLHSGKVETWDAK